MTYKPHVHNLPSFKSHIIWLIDKFITNNNNKILILEKRIIFKTISNQNLWALN